MRWISQWFIFGSIDSPVLLKPFKRDSIIKLTLKVKRVKWIVHLHLHRQVCDSSVDEVMKVFPIGSLRWATRTLLPNFMINAREGGVRAESPSNHSRWICIFHNTRDYQFYIHEKRFVDLKLVELENIAQSLNLLNY